MDEASWLRLVVLRQIVAPWHWRRLGRGRRSDVPSSPHHRILAGLLISLVLLACSVSFLHHHHDLQSSTPCPMCYAIHLPARVGAGLHIPQLAILAFASPGVVHIAWTEPSPRNCPPRAPPV